MVPKFVKYMFVYGAGHTYSNMSRLFLRLFTAVMFMQFGIRQWIHFDAMAGSFGGVLGMTSETSLTIMIAIEIVCSVMILLGFLTRLAVIPPIVSMLIVENYIFTSLVNVSPEYLISTQPGYLPIMFIGIYIFMLLAGPGRISVDYFIALRFTSTDKHAEQTLEDA